MSIENLVIKRDVALATIGKVGLNVKYPKEFELYLCALELTDERYNTLRYFVFPVMPSSNEENKPKIVNVKKTLAGVTVINTPTFIPTDITLSGTFGRKLKVLLGGDYLDLVSSFTDAGRVTAKSITGGVREVFDERVKTGYGCIKILEEICEEADSVGEDGRLRKLILHNPSIGNSYLVKVMNLKITQNEQSNMIPAYNLQLKSIAPLESIRSRSEMESASKKLVVTQYIQKKVDSVINTVTSIAARNI